MTVKVRNRRPDSINMAIPIISRGSMPIKEAGYTIVAETYQMGHCAIMVSHDPDLRPGAQMGMKLWHLSISCRDRDPTWQEIATARYRLLPHITEMAMYLPPLDEYVNVHPFTFHLHEVAR